MSTFKLRRRGPSPTPSHHHRFDHFRSFNKMPKLLATMTWLAWPTQYELNYHGCKQSQTTPAARLVLSIWASMEQEWKHISHSPPENAAMSSREIWRPSILEYTVWDIRNPKMHRILNNGNHAFGGNCPMDTPVHTLWWCKGNAFKTLECPRSDWSYLNTLRTFKRARMHPHPWFYLCISSNANKENCMGDAELQ